MLLLLLAACSDQKLGTFNGEPTAAILSHEDGSSVLEGADVAFTGSVGDPDDPNASLDVTWYLDDAVACEGAPADDGATTCTMTIGATASVRLEVRDPDGAAASDLVVLVVTPLASPEVSIDAPLSGAHLYSDLPVDLLGRLADADDLADTLVYTWTSSLDGALADGSPAADGGVADVVFLSEGNHTLTLAAVDPAGNPGEAQVGVTVGPPNGRPSCAVTRPGDGELARVGEEVLLEGTVTDPDQGADTLAASWSSDVDGLLGAVTPDSTGVVTLRTDTLTAGVHVLTLAGADELGAACSASVVLTVGGPPAVVIDAPGDGTLVGEGEVVTLSGTVVDDLDAPDEPAVSWTSDRDGALGAGRPDAAGVTSLTLDTLSPGLHTLTLTATDTDGLSASDSVTLTVNGLPSAPVVTLAPDPAGSADDLVATVVTDSVDPEGAAISYTWTWLRNGVVSGASTSSLLPASATSRGDRWDVLVTPSDGLSDGPAGTAGLTIGNTAPVATAVDISPDPASTRDTLTCTWTFADDDGDADRSTVAWTVGGTPVGTGATLASGFDRGDLVTCTVTPDDGTDTGTPVDAAITIDNAAPVLSTVSISPSSPDTDDTLSVSLAASDADGDTVAYTYAWTVNGSLAGSSATLSGASAFDKGDVVVVTVTPSDGLDAGAPVTSASVTVVDSPPSAPGVTITPASPIEGEDDLWCQVVTPSTDLDGDAVDYTMTWTVDGAPFAGARTTTWPGDTVDAADPAAGERWTCTVVADDGDIPAVGVSTSVTIGASDVSYSDTWSLDTTVSYRCAFGLVNFSFATVTIVDGYPSISVRGSGNVGTMTGSFSSATDFDADNVLTGSCTETYAISGTFTDANTFDAVIDATFTGGSSCFDCRNQSWTVTGTR